MDKTREIIAGRIREARHLAGLSQADVAKLLNVARPAITEIEAGNRKVSAEELVEFARIFDVSVSWLTGEKEEELNVNDSNLRVAARELSKLKAKDLEKILKLLASMPDGDGQ